MLLFFIIYYLLDISLIIISSLRIQYTIEVKLKWNNSQLLYICIFDSWFDGVMICYTHRVYGHSTTKLLFFNGLQHCIITSVRSVHYFHQFTWKQKILRLCWATTCISDRSSLILKSWFFSSHKLLFGHSLSRIFWLDPYLFRILLLDFSLQFCCKLLNFTQVYKFWWECILICQMVFDICL